ncbi:MAG: polyprenyl synthetase family protein, partial [Sulfitobacter sp.]|nr:polyprenyl synthetase family protein [Sulfitobacter sp.]
MFRTRLEAAARAVDDHLRISLSGLAPLPVVEAMRHA